MYIHIDKANDVNKIPEWHLMEFRGIFYKKGFEEKGEKPFFDEYFGDLNFTKQGVPFFSNGQLVMQGRLVRLRRPIAVIHSNGVSEGCEKQYVVKGLVRNKIVFLQRPRHNSSYSPNY